MLTKRIIPCLDISDGQVVKGVQFQSVKSIADPLTLGSYYVDQGADELVYYDITASTRSQSMTPEWIEAIASTINIPFTVGGGIRNIQDFYTALGAGADKISINSAALKTPQLIQEASERFGSQCVVVSMDVREVKPHLWRIFINGGHQETDLCPISWAKQAQFLGAGELVINAIHTDGMRSGFDLALTKAITEAVSIPVIASGGAGKASDFEQVFTTAHADGAIAASIFHLKQLEISTLKATLKQSGIAVRL